MKGKNSILTIDNMLGLILAILIIFQIRPNKEVSDLINTSTSIIILLVLVVVLFATMNPIVGLLALIYIYEIIRHSPSYFIKNNNIDHSQKLNSIKEIQLEETIIKDSEYTRIKNQNMDRETEVKPLLNRSNTLII